MPKPEDISQEITSIFHLLGINPPPWTPEVVALIVLISLLIKYVLPLISNISKAWTQNLQPIFYNADTKKRSRARQRFAENVILHKIDLLNRQDEWGDYRFIELEVEIDREHHRKSSGLIAFLNQTYNGLKRKKSLSKALESSTEPIILLEGEPGSGKSVALRHIAQKMLKQAIKQRSVKSIIPIYVNLKLLQRESGEKIDCNLIESFVQKSLQGNNLKIKKFLDDEFSLGMQEGTWFFLFDSFDELPDVLSSTEADKKIEEYRQAIDDFLHGMGHCHGVVSSRVYHGPSGFGWPRFRVLPLTEKQQLKLIQKTNIETESQHQLIGQIGNAQQIIRSMASNPFYLTLLCKYMEGNQDFPENAYAVFETYIDGIFNRLSLQGYQLTPLQIRKAAEYIAFSMTASQDLGLSPTRVHLQEVMIDLDIDIDGPFATILDALEEMKLARPDVTTNMAQSKSFTFAHRRFQEYFATCVVLREPQRVSPNQLFTDARWRETAIVVCQTASIENLTMFVEEANRLLIQYINTIPSDFLIPISLVPPPSGATSIEEDFFDDEEGEDISVGNVALVTTTTEDILRKGESPDEDEKSEEVPLFIESFPWPPGLLHLLNLLQDAFANRLMDLPYLTRQYVGKLVLSAVEKGILLDKRWALEVSSTVPDSTLLHLLKEAFSSKSQWLKEAAYGQAGRLSTVPEEIVQGIRDTLIERVAANRLQQERFATEAYLARLPRSYRANLLATLLLLRWFQLIDSLLHVILGGTFLFVLLHIKNSGLMRFSSFIVLFISLYLSHNVLNTLMGPLRSIKRNIGLSIFIRIVFIFMPFYYLAFPSFSWSDFLTWVLASPFNAGPSIWFGIYVALFGPLAFRVAQTGQFVSKRLWVLIPFWPFLKRFTHSKPLPKKPATQPQESPEDARWSAINKYFTTIVTILFMVFAIFPHLQDQAKNLSPILGIIVLVIQVLFTCVLVLLSICMFLLIAMIAISAIFFIVIIVIWMSRAISDWQHWQYWQKWSSKQRGAKNTLNIQELWAEANVFHRPSSRVHFLRTVREQNILDRQQETKDALAQAIAEIDKKLQSGEQKRDIFDISFSVNYRIPPYRAFIAEADSELLDELAKLLDHLYI